MHLYFKGSCVSQGEQYRISKNWHLYIFLQRNALIDIQILIIVIYHTNMAPISKTLMFYLLHEWKIHLNAKVEKFTTMVGIAVRLIIIDPF